MDAAATADAVSFSHAGRNHITSETLDLSKLMPGDMLRGTIVSIDEEGISLLLSEGQTIKASVQDQMNMMVGQKMLFSVSGNSGTKVSLSPLFFNMEQGLNAQKALESASLPANDRNLAFVSAMMEEGMAIDKESLLHMNKVMNHYPEEPVKNLVQMVRIGMPITENNVEQFSQYKNLEHQLIRGFDSIIEQLPRVYEQTKESMGTGQAVELYREILNNFTEEFTFQIKANDIGEESTYMAKPQNTNSFEVQGMLPEGIQNNALDFGSTRPNDTMLLEVLTEYEATELLAKLPQVEEKEISVITVQETMQMLKQPGITEEIFDLPAFGKLLRNQIDSQWLLKPEEIEDGKNIVRLYERVKSQTQKLSDALMPFVKEDHMVMKELNNLRNNVDFMDQLNQMFSYVQLPLKMGQFESHGELYVYTNKKALTQKDGKVSALLHLDMEHLGMLDVYVALDGEKVSTKFYLPDEETIDFMAEHMDELSNKLKNRGYQMKSEMLLKDSKEQKNTVIEEILKENRNIMAVGVGSYSFDYRV